LNREDSYLTMLEATAIMQHHISVILQAKAIEATKSKCWLCNHLSDGVFTDKEDQLKQSLEIHEKIVEVIEGLTKLESSFSKNLKVVLNDSEESSSGSDDSGFGDFFGQDDGDS
jgi:ribonuclease HIII